MDVDVEEAEGEEGAGVVGERMVEVMVGMITTKEVMVDMATREGMVTTKVGMATREVTATTKVGMATREVTATTKVAMEAGMVTTKVDMEDMVSSIVYIFCSTVIEVLTPSMKYL
jgi:hypothetical protein